ncbi:MAG TPA: SURF1 family protein [Casimicrobiaceae bacterium]|nr:SURF1 family protein [Casimicrobiaceae bacterium]
MATIVAVIVFLAAGEWQRGRLHDKEALAAQWASAAAKPVVPLSRVNVAAGDTRFRVVTATGRFDARHQILLDNRVHAGRVGYHVITPLLLDDGRAVVVNRGFIAGTRTRSEAPSPMVPEGVVTVRGRINLPPRYFEIGDAKPTGALWQNLDLSRFTSISGITVLPIVIEALDGDGDGLVRDWPLPDAGSERHRIYMAQWYLFAALAVVLWVWFRKRKT